MSNGKSLTIVLNCALIALACLPAMANSYSASASSTSTGGCGDASQTGTTSASVDVYNSNFLPLVCPGGDSVTGGAWAMSAGNIGTNAEVFGSSTVPFSMTSTATLDDTLTFLCASCTGDAISADLTGTMDADMYSMFGSPGTEYVSYTATIINLFTGLTATNSAEVCPYLADSPNCTEAQPLPLSSFHYSVSTPFTVFLGDQYSIQIVMTAFAQNAAGTAQVDAVQNDPLTLTLPDGVTFESASGQFLAPEPGSWLLMGGGLAVLLWLARRRL